MKSLNVEDLFIIIFFSTAITGILGWHWANTTTSETRFVELFAEYGLEITIFGGVVIFFLVLIFS